MTCDCSDYETPTVYRERTQIARKRHRCSECGGTVYPGEQYRYAFGVWDGSPGAFSACPQDERRKNRPKVLPLSRQAAELIAGIPRVHFDSGDDPVFVGQADEQMQRHVFATWLGNLFTRAPELLGNLRPFTPHDLRRTCRTGLARLGVDHVVAECVLGHRMPGVAGIYARHDYVPEMRAALQRWADHVDRIVSGEALDNVVEMRGR